jgi:hypothetical protein
MRVSQFYYQDPRPSNFESIELARIMTQDMLEEYGFMETLTMTLNLSLIMNLLHH